ncbi:MAG TPA: PP2C family protein-serine/threonine phosphatase [Candidatus Polarisedimenticolia bacterium]|nr:PP2C family protein-serine/threonine phosphatase [Candidatus Polarisedimenticolia bacterium]
MRTRRISPAAPRPAEPQRNSADYKALYRKLERTIDRIERMESASEVLSACLRSLVDNFYHDLGFVGGRIYERDGDHYVLRMRHGRSRHAPIGYQVPISYAPVQKALRDGLVIMRRTDPGFDETIEGAIGVSKFAAFAVGEDSRHLISITIKGPIDEEHTLYALNGVRHIINMKLHQQHLTDIIHEARGIQLSILPVEPPQFQGYDIHGESIPADVVGGDLFDYLPHSSRLLGVAVADASGHGLPAALQARDVITGMRMGMEENLKIITAIERLNRVIHRSRLSSRFISLFYGEAESNGNFIYCNAGHPPALHLHEGTLTELKLGGLVLGPNPTARYERGFVALSPGDYVLMYTDGITEAAGPGDREFGLPRLKAAFKRLAGRTAREMVTGLFGELASFTQEVRQGDDRTLVVVRRI